MVSPSLPIEAHRDAILSALRDGTTLLLSAETGSGKTTVVPRMLLEQPVVPGKVIVLQPRRIATRAAARRVAEVLGEPIGRRVGFVTRHERCESRETRLLFVTDGLFLRMVQSDPTLRGVGVVMVDEFHERSLATDLAVGLVRALQASDRRDLRLVVASATLDARTLATTLGAADVTIPGRLHPVELSYQPPPRDDEPAWRHASRVAAAAVQQGEAGDILVFLPGKGEIDRCVSALRDERAVQDRSIQVVPLHGSLPAAAQDDAIREGATPRIVVATNVAETSLTIPGVTLVIDSGLVRIHRFDPRRGLNTLRVEPTSQASATQRAGRAGRVRPGRCIRLWSERSHARRAAFEAPEVERVELAESRLLLASLGWRDPDTFPWVTPPPTDRLEAAGKSLSLIGALDADGSVTALGSQLASIPVHPRLGRFMLEGHAMAVGRRAATWAAIVSERDPAERMDREQLAQGPSGDDPMGDIVARERLVECCGAGDGPSPHGADRGACREIEQAARQILRAARDVADADPWPTDVSEHDRLVRALLTAFPDRVGWRLDALRPSVAMEGVRACELSPQSLHTGTGPLLALDIGDRTDGRRTLAVLGLVEPVPEALLRECLPSRFTRVAAMKWDPTRQVVVEAQDERFDGTIITSRTRDVVDPLQSPGASGVLADEIIAKRVRLHRWDDSVDRWLARARTVSAWFPDRRIPLYDDEELGVLLRDLCEGAVRASEVRDREVLPVLQGALSWDDLQFIERMAPHELPLPSGRRLRIDYTPGQAPRARSRIQDFFGLTETPRVGGGRIPVLLELTGPNLRPLQVTGDLANFWRVLYPEIRPELSRRYPKHDWREDGTVGGPRVS
ncbi:MAG: ATP-dependent helicase HrpB [Planctomycetota bacterium]|nr:ATP-dependent helicase HrpB [Planctomycetota bacterium]MDA1105950.1 ATP-dependent helicase HrpB [Planctomycetota bacterium]